MKTYLLALATIAQLALPLTARADDDYLAKIAEITRREELLAESKKLNEQMNVILANNDRILQAMEPVRAELKAAEAECRLTCTGPATRQLLKSTSELSKIAVGASVATGVVRYGLKKWALSKGGATAERLGAVGTRFKVLTGGAIAASLAATYVSGQVNQYIDSHDEASTEQIASIRNQLSTLQATLHDSNQHVAKIVAANDRIVAALQADLTVIKAIAK